jgi:PAS domain S-box-containing protein
MPAPKLDDTHSKRERALVAEIRTLKSRLAKYEHNDDVTAQNPQRMNQTLCDCEQRGRALLNAMSDMMYRFTIGGTIVDFKATPEHLLIAPDQVIGMNIMDMPVPEDVRQLVLGAVVKSIETGEPQEFVCRLEMPGGVRIYENRYVKSGDREAVGIVRDITERKRVDEMLKTQKYYLEKAQEIGRIGTWELDLRQNILRWTDENYRIFGVPLGTERTYETFLDCVHPDDRDYVHEKWSAALQHEPYDIEHRLIVDGKIKWVREKADVTFDENGIAIEAIGFTQDITDHKQAEDKIREGEELYRLMFKNSHDLITIVDEQAKALWVNPAWINVFGDPAVQPDPFERIHPDDVIEVKTAWQSLVTGKTNTFCLEYQFRLEDGNYMTFESTATTFVLGGKTVFCVFAHDITERMRVMNELKENQQRLTSFMNSATDGFILFDSELNHRDINRSALDITGMNRNEVIGKNILEVVPNLKETGRYEQYREVVSTGMPLHIPDLIPHPHFGEKHVNLKAFKVGNGLGMILTDITDSKLAAQDLKEQHTIFNQLLEQTLAGYWDWRIQENTEYMSPTFKRMFGYEDHELANVPETWQTLIFPEDLPGVFEEFHRHVDSHGKVPFYNEVRYRHKDGSTIWVICAGQVIEWGANGEPMRMIGCHVNITRRKQTEERLRDSEKRSHAWLEYSPVSTKIIDLDFNLQYMSTAGVKQLSIEDITQYYGTPYPLSFYPDSFRKPMIRNLEKSKETGETVTQEASVVDIQGNVLWYHSTLVPVKDDQGHVAYIMVVSIETTKRKQVEKELLDHQTQLKSLTSELVLAEERERQRLALCLHDEVCQSLAFVKMRLQMVNGSLEDQAHSSDLTEVCETLSDMMNEVRSLTFELSSPILSEFGLEAAVSNWLKEQIEQKHGIHTVFSKDEQDKPLSKDVQVMLFRSVRELLINAVKYSESHTVEVNISREEDQIVITIEDNGIGFTPENNVVSEKSGGFGLFSIRERMDQLGGSLDIQSSPGQGCQSILYAPLQQTH